MATWLEKNADVQKNKAAHFFQIFESLGSDPNLEYAPGSDWFVYLLAVPEPVPTWSAIVQLKLVLMDYYLRINLIFQQNKQFRGAIFYIKK